MRLGWHGFCNLPGCACLAADSTPCDEYEGLNPGVRCPRCGWPAHVHSMRDDLARAGFALTLTLTPITRPEGTP